MRAALAPLSSFLASHPDSYWDTFCSLFSNYFTQSHIGCKATNIIPAWGLIFFAGADLLENKVAQRTLRTTKITIPIAIGMSFVFTLRSLCSMFKFQNDILCLCAFA